MSSVIKSGPAAFRRIQRRQAASGAPSWTVLLDTPAVPDAGEAPEMDPAADPIEESRRILSAAEERARGIVSAARAEAARIEEEARAEGYAHGAERAEAVWAERFAELEGYVAAFEEERRAFYDSAEPELALLATDIARKVIRREVEAGGDVVLGVVRAAMHRIKDRQVRILVNPKDLEPVRGYRDVLSGIADGAPEIEIVSDRRVGQGGCVLETPSGKIDARIESQLEGIGETIARGCTAEGAEAGADDFGLLRGADGGCPDAV